LVVARLRHSAPGTPDIGPPHPRAVDRQLLPAKGHDARLAARPRVRAVGLVLIPRTAQPGHLVLQKTRSDEQTQLDGQTLQGVLHQAGQLVPIQGKPHLSVGLVPLGSTFGRLSLVSDPSVRLGSFPGGSSSTKG
jgi:hypothetical protein